MLSSTRRVIAVDSPLHLREPIRIRLNLLKEQPVTGLYDNSENNPNNPDPKKLVAWGDQTWEEMMIAKRFGEAIRGV
jgi:hypothetical protein